MQSTNSKFPKRILNQAGRSSEIMSDFHEGMGQFFDRFRVAWIAFNSDWIAGWSTAFGWIYDRISILISPFACLGIIPVLQATLVVKNLGAQTAQRARCYCWITTRYTGDFLVRWTGIYLLFALFLLAGIFTDYPEIFKPPQPGLQGDRIAVTVFFAIGSGTYSGI